MGNSVKAAETPWQIRPEGPEDAPFVDALVAASFGPGRYTKSAYRLREGVAPVPSLGFVAIENGVLRGSVRFWPAFAGKEKILLLGPLAVQSDQRGRGMGIALMQAGIEKAKGSEFTAIILVGDEPYYARAGFTRVAPGRLRFPGPVNQARVLGLSLASNALLTLSGQIRRTNQDHPVCADSAGLGAR